MDVINELRGLIDKYKDFLVVVEGIKDKKALEKLGFKRILIIKEPLYKIVEKVLSVLEKTSEKECIILTDLDKEGKKLYARLNSDLSQRGVRINNQLRNFIFKHTSLNQIEGLVTYINKQTNHVC